VTNARIKLLTTNTLAYQSARPELRFGAGQAAPSGSTSSPCRWVPQGDCDPAQVAMQLPHFDQSTGREEMASSTPVLGSCTSSETYMEDGLVHSKEEMEKMRLPPAGCRGGGGG
jgi:hypothetical protein